MSVIGSRSILEETAQIVNSKNTDKISASTIGDSIEVENISGTDMIEITSRSDSSDAAAAIVNTLIDVYVEQNIQGNRAEATAAIEFIESQLPQTASAVQDAEQNLSSFKEQNQIVVLQEESSQTVNSIAELEEMLANDKAQLAQLEDREASIKSGRESGSETASISRDMSLDPNFQEAVRQLKEIQAQLAIEQGRYNFQHPSILNLEEEETRLKERLYQTKLAQLEVQRSGLETRIKKFSDLLNSKKKRMIAYPQLEQTQRGLERKLSTAQVTHESLLKNLQEARVAENQTIANVRIVSKAQAPQEPVTALNKLIFVGGVLVFAPLVGLTTVFILELFDRSIKDIQQLSKLLASPFFGVIPFYTSSKKFLPLPKKASKQASARVFNEYDTDDISMIYVYNLLQSKLSSLIDHENVKIITVTSSVAQEGKSEVSANLAAAYFRAGQRVLLIDASLHEPSQHRIWGLENDIGLNQVLAGQVKFKDVLHPVSPNFFVLPTGYLSEDIELSNVKPMSLLIDEVSHNFDVVIIDTSSIIKSTNASSLSQLADITLFVVRPGKADISSIRIAEQALEYSNEGLIGIVANAVEGNGIDDLLYFQPKEELNETNTLPYKS